MISMTPCALATAPVDANPESAPRRLTIDTLRAEIGTLLPDSGKAPGRTFSDDDNLIEFGLDSLHVMRLVSGWRQAGANVTFSALIEQPTLAAWWALIRRADVPAAAGSTAAPASVSISEHSPRPLLKTAREETEEARDEHFRAFHAPFALTDVQHAYWIGRRDDQPLGGVGCHAYLELDGQDIDPPRLEKAWRMLLRRHGMLRAVFDEEGSQRIGENPTSTSDAASVPINDLRGLPPEAISGALRDIRERLSHRRLNIEAGEVAGLELSLLPEGATRIHFDLDLLVADVQSMQIILRDLAAAYARDEESAAISASTSVPTSAPTSGWSFARYLEREEQRRRLTREEDRGYWRQRLPDLPGGPALPLRRAPEEISRPRFSRRIHRLTPDEWHRLRRFAAARRITPAMILVAAYAEILARWSASPRFLLNLPLFDRQTGLPGIEDAVADFTNLLLLEADCGTVMNFAERARTLQAQFHADAAHAGYSGVRIQRDLAQMRPGERTFAPVVFACNLGAPLLGDECRSVLGELAWMISQTPQVWLDHQVYEMDGGLLLTWDSVDELFPEGLMDEMFAAYGRLIDALAQDGTLWEQPLSDLLPPSQREMRETINATAAPMSRCLLHEDFFAIACDEPERTALIDGETTFTYGKLADQSLRIAAFLVERGVLPGDPVAVTLPRGAGQVMAVLGILAAGGCYVPVGVGQPTARRERIHRTAGIRHVLAAAELAAAMERSPLEWTPQKRPLPALAQTPAYVIFTSGSTGDPKGVEIAHQAARNTIDDINRRYGIGPDDRVLAVSALDFDLSVYDLFGLLSVGGALVLVGEEERRDAAAWIRMIRAHGVTLWNSVPVLLDMLLVVAESETASSPLPVSLPLRLTLLSGDWVGLDLPGRLAAATGSACRMVALGGATEASIWSNAFEVNTPVPAHWASIPYGFPLANQSYRVVDALGRDRPDWVPGELWIGGAGVATCYRGDPALTAQRFVEDAGGRWYRTGDLGRYWPDGTLEFLGRADHQVKVRGHRIELGEIEAALHLQPGVRHAVAVAVGQPATLAAAVVLEAPSPNKRSEQGGERIHDAHGDALERIRSALSERLPDYMVPAVLVAMETLPLSANGKVDRKAVSFALAGTHRSARRREPPREGLERKIAAAWREVLQGDLQGNDQNKSQDDSAGAPVTAPTGNPISRDDDFFMLGGDSLRAIQLLAKLRQHGLSAKNSLQILFANPVLADFAAELAAVEETSQEMAADTMPEPLPEAAVTPDPEHRYEPFPLTEVQQAYLMGQNPGLPLHCGTIYGIELDGENVDLDRLADAWNRLIERHEMLRAHLDGEGMQRILPSVPRIAIDVQTMTGDDPAAAGRLLAERRQRHAHDRTRWPLHSLHAVRYGKGRCRLGLFFDYLLLDGFSIKILLGELAGYYRDPHAALPPLELSFRDYVAQVAPDAEALERARTYWRERLDDLPPAPALPLAVDPADVSRAHFRRREMRLPEKTWQALRAQARARGITPSATLLTAYAEILARWSGGTPFTLNLTLFDRKDVHPDIHRVLGDFTTLVPVSFSPSEKDAAADATAERTAGGFLADAREIQREIAEVLEHRAVSSIRVQRERARRFGLEAAALPVVFTSTIGLADETFQDLPEGFPRLAGGGFSETPQVWLDHQVYALDGGLLLTWDSVDELFPEGLLDEMFAAYGQLLDKLAREASPWEPSAPGAPPSRRGKDNGKNGSRGESRGTSAASTAPAHCASPAPSLHEPPRDDLERKIAAVWQEVLQCERISRDDDFFMLGGDSLRATRIFALMQTRGISPEALPLRLLFSAPTVAGLAAHIREIEMRETTTNAATAEENIEEGIL